MHNNNPKLWIAAAKYEFENGAAENGRQILLRGLRFHPGCKHLHRLVNYSRISGFIQAVNFYNYFFPELLNQSLLPYTKLNYLLDQLINFFIVYKNKSMKIN